MKTLLLWLLLCSTSLGEDHWATGGWDCRAWGAIRLYEEPYKFSTDVDPDGFLTDFGRWQDYDQNSILIIWLSGKAEIITKENNKHQTQTAYSFGIASTIEETSKIIANK